MSRFKNNERVQIIANISSYYLKYGTVVETNSASVSVAVDGLTRPLKFWDTELLPASTPENPQIGLLKTQNYLRELEEDTKILSDAAGIYPQGTSLQKDLEAFAKNQRRIVANLKLVLRQDGVTLWEDKDGSK